MKKALLLVFLFLLAGCAAGAATATPTRPAVPTFYPTPTAGAWDGHGLKGSLVLIPYASGSSELVRLDLASGASTSLFKAPTGGWIAWAAVSPDGSQAALAYTPPPASGKQQFSFSDLYLLPLNPPGEPRPLLTRQSDYESFFSPTWAPDGKSLYYAHFFNATPGGTAPTYRYTLERVGLDGTQPRVLVQDAIWPAVSPDGSQISYLTSGANGVENALTIAASDGSSPQAVLSPGALPQPVDAHMFSPDGKSLYFSMPNPQPGASQPWWELVLGIGVAQAHNQPSDWYTAPAGPGGQARRVSQVNDTYFNGHLSPDGAHLAFIGMNGLFVVDLATQQTVRLSPVPYLSSVDWIK